MKNPKLGDQLQNPIGQKSAKNQTDPDGVSIRNPIIWSIRIERTEFNSENNRWAVEINGREEFRTWTRLFTSVWMRLSIPIQEFMLTSRTVLREKELCFFTPYIKRERRFTLLGRRERERKLTIWNLEVTDRKGWKLGSGNWILGLEKKIVGWQKSYFWLLNSYGPLVVKEYQNTKYFIQTHTNQHHRFSFLFFSVCFSNIWPPWVCSKKTHEIFKKKN